MPFLYRYSLSVFVFFILGLLPGPIRAQHVGFYFENSGKRASIPFELHNNLIIISAMLNDEHPVKFILDTGVRPTILLNKNFTDSIGMAYQREVELFGVGNNASVRALVAEGVSLSIRNVGNNRLSVLVLEENLLELEQHLGAKIHGILGYDFFGRFVVKINYQKMSIDLFEPNDFEPPTQYNVIDLELDGSKPFASVMICQDSASKIKANLLIDTGASHALILNPLSDESIKLPDKFIISNLGRSLTGPLSGKVGRIDQMSFGGFSLEDVIVSYLEEKEVGKEELLKNGSIGGELLCRFTVIFDYYHKKLYIRPNRSFRQPFEYNMSGLEFIAAGENLNKFIINNIRAGSAAEQVGFRTGDMLVSLNEIPVKKLSLSRIYAQLSSRQGKLVTLTVLRDGFFVSRSFHLKKEI
jgi:predicted aspartyl protease